MGQLEGGGTARGTECRTERVAHGGERAHTGSCADGLAACMPPVLVSGVVMMCASLETVAHIKLVSTVEGPPTNCSLSPSSNQPFTPISKTKGHQQGKVYFTVNRINNALRPRERGREGGRGRERERDALRPRERGREAGTGRERERTLCHEQ